MTKVNFKPLYDRVLVEEAAAKTSGGIIIPDTVKTRGVEGEVVAIGDGYLVDGNLVPLKLKVGDKVTFGRNQPIEMMIENKKYLILKETDVLGVFTK